MRDWQFNAQQWLRDCANEHYICWLATKAGKRYLTLKGKSPYHAGYAQPQFMHDARLALAQNDEEAFKAVRLGVTIVGQNYGST